MKDRIKNLLKEFLKPKPVKWKLTTASLIVGCICLFMGFLMGYYEGTGLLPTFTNTESIGIPEISVTTLTDVQATLEEAPKEEYRFGYNCIDFAWDAMRRLNWSGQPATVIGLVFEKEPYHALLLTATKDEGWVFVEPEAGIVVKPRIGGLYLGRRITAIRVMTIVWVPIEEFVENPVFEEVK